MADTIDKVLEGFGLSESVNRVKLSRGVVGKTTAAIITFMGLLAVIAARAPIEGLIWIVAVAAVVFLIYLLAVMVFANRNPGASLLEGAELLRWQQTEVSAKGVGPIAPSAALPPQSEVALIDAVAVEVEKE